VFGSEAIISAALSIAVGSITISPLTLAFRTFEQERRRKDYRVAAPARNRSFISSTSRLVADPRSVVRLLRAPSSSLRRGHGSDAWKRGQRQCTAADRSGHLHRQIGLSALEEKNGLLSSPIWHSTARWLADFHRVSRSSLNPV
jgi:hypothetical protein